MTSDGGAGTLFVVSTPIGNLGDFSFRAVGVLRSVSVILAEDTRHTRQLLDRYEVRTPTASYHEHNEARMTPVLVERLRAGESFALVSDAGTPLLSDPGARLVSAAVEAGISVTPIPGASALMAGLVGSGLPLDRFTFFGFLTRSGKQRRSELRELSEMRHTAVLYESPNRLADTLAELEALGNGARPAVVAREMTKLYEEFRRGTVSELRAYYEGSAPRGEIVLLLGGVTTEPPSEEMVAARVQALQDAGMSTRDAAAAAAAELGVPRRLAYRLAQNVGAKKETAGE